ncbi:MAG: hypothetical protein C4325_12495, partial [Blastocatellia bacterium]
MQPTGGEGTYTYTVTAYYDGCTTASASATAQLVVAQQPAPPPNCPIIDDFNANPTCPQPNQTVALFWAARFFDSVHIFGPNVDQYFFPPQNNGSVSFTAPSQSASYTISATNQYCPAVQRQLTLGVAQTPVISNFDASPAQINQGQSSTLNWNVQQAETVRLQGPGIDE